MYNYILLVDDHDEVAMCLTSTSCNEQRTSRSKEVVFSRKKD